jgi:HK97 family phage major capsid protein
LPFAREPQRILSLVPNVATDRPIEMFYRTAGTTGAAPVAEGALKPASTIAYTPIQVAVTKIAHTVHVTDESLEDFNGFSEYLSADMVNGVVNAENAELLSSLGTGASKWPGLLNTTGVLTRAKASETYSLDVIEESIDDLRVGASYCEPTDIVMNPSTWGTLRRTKNTQGSYLIDPDPTAASRLSLWGIPVTLTTQMPVGKALLGDFGGGCYAFVRQGILVESTNSNSDDFVKNLNTVRAETRIGLCVTRPASFIVASGL